MPFTAKLWETDTSHMLVGVWDGPFPEKGVQMSIQTTYAFTLGLQPSYFQKSIRKRTSFARNYSLVGWLCLKSIMTLSTSTATVRVQMQKLQLQNNTQSDMALTYPSK